MPTNRTPRTPAITIRVVAAFLDSGGLNAGTPVAIASVPVSATAPDENARSSTRMPTAWVVSVAAAMASGGAPACSPRTTIRKTPRPIIEEGADQEQVGRDREDVAGLAQRRAGWRSS